MCQKVKYFFIGSVLFSWSCKVLAQDTISRKSIDIISSYKPVLREASKVLLLSQPLPVDTNKRVLKYNIPVQPLVIKYSPVETMTSNLDAKKTSGWDFNRYLKIGVGNLYKPMVKAGMSFGSGSTSSANLFLYHSSSKGSLPFQQNRLTRVEAAATYAVKNDLEWNASLKASKELYYKYGFSPNTLIFEKSALEQQFNSVEGALQLRNTIPTDLGLSFRPRLGLTVFGDGHDNKAKETNLTLDVPIEKSIGRLLGVKLGVFANLTTYEWQKSGGYISWKNQLLTVSPSFLIKTPNVYLSAGVKPSWDQSVFHVLPDVLLEVTTMDDRFTFQGGWSGGVQVNSYKTLAAVNPWLLQPDSLRNTIYKEYFAGIKGSMESHFSYSAKIGFLQFERMPLFVNDKLDGKSFELIYEKKAQALQLHSELGYTIGEDFAVNATFNYRKFTKVEKELRAWGVMPLELNAGFHWQVLKDLMLSSDFFLGNGAPYRGVNGDAFKGDAVFDLNAAAEFKILPYVNLWLQLNNILNTKYQRWHQYQNYGFSIMGGVLLNFDKFRKSK